MKGENLAQFMKTITSEPTKSLFYYFLKFDNDDFTFKSVQTAPPHYSHTFGALNMFFSFTCAS